MKQILFMLIIAAASRRSSFFVSAGYGLGNNQASVLAQSVVCSPQQQALHSRGGEKSKSGPHVYRVIQVHVIHRHGDRSPITPMKNESYWKSELVQQDLLAKISKTTKVIRGATKNTHLAGGRGPFGKLTQLGLLQMVQVGTTLREELSTDQDNDPIKDEHGNLHYNRIFDACRPILPHQIKVYSTDFERTIQSAQGTLIGLFPDASTEHIIEIDARHTSILIPDPQPRRSPEQVDLENHLAARPHVQARDDELQELAITTTAALKHLLGDDAFDVSFGVGEEKEASEQKPKLSWGQLSEITKCLAVRNMLPSSITSDMQTTLSEHVAWKWFDMCRNARMAYLAMNPLVQDLVKKMQHKISSKEEDSIPLHLYSAHDSTLIGLISAFRLENPTSWPEYGSVLKVELVEVTLVTNDETAANLSYQVRFSLNGKVLRSKWEGDGDDDGCELDMIGIEDLANHVSTKDGKDTAIRQ